MMKYRLFLIYCKKKTTNINIIFKKNKEKQR